MQAEVLMFNATSSLVQMDGFKLGKYADGQMAEVGLHTRLLDS